MAQVWIREYDAKRMFFESIGKKYKGVQIDSIKDVKKLDKDKQYVLKPDMLFWGRGKLGLVAVDFDKKESEKWLEDKLGAEQSVWWIDGTLDVFLAEELAPHTKEYYVSFQAGRDADTMHFSETGWVDIEANWDSVKSLDIPTMEELTEAQIKDTFDIAHKDIIELLMNLWRYYKDYGYVYLEVNPFCFHQETGDIVLLDMVAKLDDMEVFRQKWNWTDLTIPNTYGFKENKREAYIRNLDEQTGACLKFKILNPDGMIWTLFAGWGASLAMSDTLGSLGYAQEIWTYTDLSGNPGRENIKEYTRTLIDQMLDNKKKWKYFIIAWVIANFTNIKTTFAGIIDVLEEKADEINKQETTILVRRWGIEEKAWLQALRDACKKLNIPCQIDDSTKYMTEILQQIKI